MRGRLIFLLLLGALSGAWTSARAQKTSARPTTVVGYYLALPQKCFVLPTSVAERRKLLKEDEATVDTRNDYLAAGQYSRSIVVALFRHQGRILVAVTDYYAPDDASSFHLLRLEGGAWKDVTSALLPIPYNPRMSYELPRHGTTIHVAPSSGDMTRNNYDLLWSGDKFKLQRR